MKDLDQYLIPALLSMLGFFIYRLINKIDDVAHVLSDLKGEFKSVAENVRRIDSDLHSQVESQNKVIEKMRDRIHLALNIIQVLLTSVEAAGIKVVRGAWTFEDNGKQ